MVTKPSLEEQADKLSIDADLGYSSELVLKAFDPWIERRLSALLDEFSLAAPELGILLDIRARICVVWSIRKELKKGEAKGKDAVKRMEAILGNVSDNRTP